MANKNSLYSLFNEMITYQDKLEKYTDSKC